MPKTKFRGGWKKDKRDDRDRLRGAVKVALPDKVDLSATLPPVRDQGNLGSCTGFGVGGNISGTALDQDADVDPTSWFSPMWVYQGARLIEGSLPYDDGAYPRDCFEFLRSNGCLPERFHPYHDTLETTDPLTWGVNDEAAKWPIVSYTRLVDGVDGILGALADGHLVSIGSPWYDDWMDVGSDGVLPEIASGTWPAGGHETLLYGYDATKRVLYGQNSWGTGWGRGGRYTMPFSSIDRFKESDGYDAHIVDVDWGPVVPPPGPGPEPPPPTPVSGIPTWVWIGLGILAVGAIVYLLVK